jgi:hypothetical protein
MKIKSRLIGLAVVCLGIPATVVAQSKDEGLEGTWLLKMSVHNMPGAISAVSICNRDGSLEHFDYQPVPRIFGNGAETQLYVGSGSWARMGNGQFEIKFKSEVPNRGSQQVEGIATLSASRNEVTGSAKVEFLNQDGTVVYTEPVTVIGHRARTSRLTAKR